MRSGFSRLPRAVLASLVAAVVPFAIGASLLAPGALGHGHRMPGHQAGFKRHAARLGATVTVTRDASGVAHIAAGNFTALGEGEGFAFAQDNLCSFADDIVTVEGEPPGRRTAIAPGQRDLCRVCHGL